MLTDAEDVFGAPGLVGVAPVDADADVAVPVALAPAGRGTEPLDWPGSPIAGEEPELGAPGMPSPEAFELGVPGTGTGGTPKIELAGEGKMIEPSGRVDRAVTGTVRPLMMVMPLDRTPPGTGVAKLGAGARTTDPPGKVDTAVN